MARNMNFEFLKTVFIGDTIKCHVEIEKYEKQKNYRTAIMAAFICENQNEIEVLKGDFSGVIL